MSEITLTKEQVAELIGDFKSRSRPLDWAKIDALSTLASQAIDMRPRPISEAPKNVWGLGMVSGVKNSWQMCMLGHEGPAKLASTGQWVFRPTHFIPLSSLPTGGE